MSVERYLQNKFKDLSNEELDKQIMSTSNAMNAAKGVDIKAFYAHGTKLLDLTLEWDRRHGQLVDCYRR